MSRLVRKIYYSMDREKRPKNLKVTVSTSSFVPKPFTPFQWVPQDTMDKLGEKQDFCGMLWGKEVTYNWNDPEASFLEAVAARGDRRLGRIILSAWKKGARFDSWSEQFNMEAWKKAFEEEGLIGLLFPSVKERRMRYSPGTILILA